MKTLLAWVGAAALVLWTAGGLVFWLQTRDHVSVVLQSGAVSRVPAQDPLAGLEARLDELAEGPRALAHVLEQNVTLLDERMEQRSQTVQHALAGELVELRSELRELRAELERTELAAAASPIGAERPLAAAGPGDATFAASLSAPPEPPGRLDAIVAPVPSAAAEVPALAPAAAARSSFLAFQLPQDDFRFDERRSWTIVAAQSRVGFDAQSTLHDFSGTSTAVAGSIAFQPAQPALEPSGEIRVQARTLSTDNEGRDAEMLADLDVAQHAEIAFRLTRFEALEVDAAEQRLRGVAHGTLRLRGVERPFSMPVQASLDAGRRLLLEGEAPLSLTDFGVPVPSKLGLISMDETVVLWIALRARLDAREPS